MIMSFFDAILGTVLLSFIVIILSSFMALFVEFLFPSFTKWTRMILFIIVLTVVLKPALDHFIFIRDVAHAVTMLFISAYPILTASMIAAGGAFSLLNFQPAMLIFANGAVVLIEKLLIPLLTAALVLDISTRLLAEVPFKRLAELIRTTLLGTVSAIVAAYSIFITVGGTMSWAMTGLTSEPIKELIQQNIPFIGSFMTDSIGTIGRYSSGVSVFVGGWLIVGIWTVALLPTMKTLVTALLYRWLAAIIEPFAHKDITGLLDDVGKTLFVLCAISFLISFAFIYTALFSIVIIKLLTTIK